VRSAILEENRLSECTIGAEQGRELREAIGDQGGPIAYSILSKESRLRELELVIL